MENKKIGMAINYNYHDYGGILQAYASFKKIKDLGYEPEAINIDSISSDIKRRKIIYFINNIFDISIVREKSQIILKKIRIKTNKKFKNNISKRDLEFEKFSKSHFIVSREYKDWEDLRCGCESYSSVVVGSDQLWLPSNIAGDYYTLSFVPDNINKIAYAMNDFLLGLKIFIENPILGIGFNNTEPFMMRNTYNDTGILGSSNGFMTIAYTTGIVGMVFVLLPFIYNIIKRKKERYKSVLYFIMIVFFNFSEPVYYFPFMMYILVKEYRKAFKNSTLSI